MVKLSMTIRDLRLAFVGVVLLSFGCVVGNAGAVEMQNLVRIKGMESSKLTGMGLVVGLNGTGDGGKSMATMSMLSNMMNSLGHEVVTAADLRDAENVAVVLMSVKTPRTGFREGDEFDIEISAPLAESLVGGRLIAAPLTGVMLGSPVYAFGEGPVLVQNPANPARAKVSRGATMVADNYTNVISEDGLITLVINQEYATHTMANRIAMAINGSMAPDSPPMCFALDGLNVIVRVPDVELRNPVGFISRLMELYMDQSLIQTEARVVASRLTGTIVFTGDVEVSPVLVMHNGLTVTTLNPPIAPTVERPEIVERSAIAIDPAGQGGESLNNLIMAFDQLKVPVEDRISILEKIRDAGKLHAVLTVEE